jgi:tripeptidyl-peptidase-1
VKDESVKFNKETSTMSLMIHLVHQDMDKFHDLAMSV